MDFEDKTPFGVSEAKPELRWVGDIRGGMWGQGLGRPLRIFHGEVQQASGDVGGNFTLF